MSDNNQQDLSLESLKSELEGIDPVDTIRRAVEYLKSAQERAAQKARMAEQSHSNVREEFRGIVDCVGQAELAQADATQAHETASEAWGRAGYNRARQQAHEARCKASKARREAMGRVSQAEAQTVACSRYAAQAAEAAEEAADQAQYVLSLVDAARSLVSLPSGLCWAGQELNQVEETARELDEKAQKHQAYAEGVLESCDELLGYCREEADSVMETAAGVAGLETLTVTELPDGELSEEL